MKNDISNIRKIILKKLSKGLSAEEEKELLAWMNDSEFNKDAVSVFFDTPALRDAVQEIYASREKVWNSLKDEIKMNQSIEKKRFSFFKSNSRRYRFTAAAAVCVIVISLGVFIKLYQKEKNAFGNANKVFIVNNDVEAPQSTSATIVLSDGSVVPLSDLKNGTIGLQGNSQIVVNEDGTIHYDIVSQNKKNTPVVYNTITNPAGSKVVNITLSDGTRVWLNSSSSITYPTFFSGEKREIEITGEIYFEVQKDKKSNFFVNIGKRGVVEVRGTSFNVNSYEDELSADITLLEGSLAVKDNKTGKDLLLKPNQQGRLFQNGDIILNTSPNVSEVMAWKNGTFDFGVASDINAIMRQISRWYGVDVQFSKKMNTLIGGEIPRDVNLSEVLKMLEMTGVLQFSIEGRTVFVKEPEKK